MSALNSVDSHSARPIRFRDYLPQIVRGDDATPASFQDQFLQVFEETFEELQALLEGVFPGDLHLTVDSDPLSRSPEFSEGDFISVFTLVKRLRAQLPKISNEDAAVPEDPVSLFLVKRFPSEAREVLDKQDSTIEKLETLLHEELNNILRESGSIFEAQRFASVVLSVETLFLKSQNPQGDELIRLNRLLLEDAYPVELARIGTEIKVKQPSSRVEFPENTFVTLEMAKMDTDSTTLAVDYPGKAGPTRLLVRDADFAKSVAHAPGSKLVLHAGGVPDLFNPDLTPPPQFARRLGLDDDYQPEPDSSFLNFLASWIGLSLRDDLIARPGEADVDGQARPDDPTYSRRKARWNQHLFRTAVGIYPRRSTLGGLKEMLQAWLKDDLAERSLIVTDLLRHDTDVDAVFQLGVRATLGVDTFVGEGPPFVFIADLMPDPTVRALRTPAGIDIFLREARFILDTETPAHASYELRVRANSMQLAPKLGDEKPTEVYAQIGETTLLWSEPFVLPEARHVTTLM